MFPLSDGREQMEAAGSVDAARDPQTSQDVDNERDELVVPLSGAAKEDSLASVSRLTKVTVNLVPRAMKALEEFSESTGDTKTECINRAVLVAGWLQVRIDAGDELCLIGRDGRTRAIHFL